MGLQIMQLNIGKRTVCVTVRLLFYMPEQCWFIGKLLRNCTVYGFENVN